MPLKENAIQRKLVRIVLLVSSAVLLSAGTTILIYEFLTFRRTTVQQASTLGQIIAANSTAALAFDSPKDANEILSAMNAAQPVVGAALYTKEGKLFSHYPADSTEADFPVVLYKDGYRFAGSTLEGFEPVILRGKRIGTLYLKWDVRTAYQRFLFYGAFITLVMTVCLLAAAYSLSRILRREISEPILELAETAKTVSNSQDYSVRAKKIGDQDELAFLTDVFNQMLARIQTQNTALTANEHRLRAVLNSTMTGVIVINAEGKIIDWNARAETMFGWSKAEAIGQELAAKIIPEQFRDAHRRGLDHYLKTNEAPVLNRVLEMTALRRNGTEFPVELSIVAMESDHATTFCGFITDITERKQTATKLQTQLSRMELLERITRATAEHQDLRSVFQVVIGSLERDLPIQFGCICLYEPAEETLSVMCVGNKSEPLADELAMTPRARIPVEENGLSVCVKGELVYEPEAGRVRSSFPQRLASHGLNSFVAAPLIVDESVIGVLIAARTAPHSFSSPDCEFIRYLSAHTALAANQAKLYTALQVAYNDVRQTQQAVLQQERLSALGQMASGIAHDINNAISPIALYIESLLEKEPDLSERARRYLQVSQRAIDDVAKTIARMREFYREREPQLPLVSVNLNDLVYEVKDLTHARWSDMPQQLGIVIRMENDLASDLPTIMAVESEIREALVNLIFNSVDAMPEGGKMTIRTGTRQKFVCVEVCDSGTGMDEPTRRRCLEPFFTTKGERGTGLGLAMVYGMTQRHHGEIQIESQVGKGTTMRLLFPRSAPAVTELVPTPALSHFPARILIVDDDPLLIQALRDTLERDGHRVTTAGGGQEGMDTFEQAHRRMEPFEVVITDLGMPYVDGRKVAAFVKELSPDTPVILLTGWGHRLVADDDIPNDVDRVLNKPPRLNDLRSAITELISQRAGGQAL
jgi:PAS domain S-box-containing protein